MYYSEYVAKTGKPFNFRRRAMCINSVSCCRILTFETYTHPHTKKTIQTAPHLFIAFVVIIFHKFIGQVNSKSTCLHRKFSCPFRLHLPGLALHTLTVEPFLLKKLSWPLETGDNPGKMTFNKTQPSWP